MVGDVGNFNGRLFLYEIRFKMIFRYLWIFEIGIFFNLLWIELCIRGFVMLLKKFDIFVWKKNLFLEWGNIVLWIFMFFWYEKIILVVIIL